MTRAQRERAARGEETPRLASLRMPVDASPLAMVGNAHTLWRLVGHKRTGPALESGNPLEEYRSVCEFMRLYATLRFYQLALLLGTTGSIVTALSSAAVRESFARVELLRCAGALISLAFLLMEFRASSYWHRLRDRGNELAATLRFQSFPAAWRWNPLTTSGAGFYLHILTTSLWVCSLFLRLQPAL